MNYNYHTHTHYCGHAKGTIEEYIERAVSCGVKYMGFSDHAPFICDDGYESSVRVPLAKAKDYIADISALREKYKDKIDITIGFEMEYYPLHFEKMLKTVKELGAEYLILGEHFVKEEHPNGKHLFGETTDEELLREYATCIIEGMKSGVFTYVAHPDAINFCGDEESFRAEMRRICKASKELGIPIEINLFGIFDNRHYPSERFWRIAGEEGCPVTFGFDAHSAFRAYDGESFEKAMEMVKKYNLNYIGMPKIIPIQ